MYGILGITLAAAVIETRDLKFRLEQIVHQGCDDLATSRMRKPAIVRSRDLLRQPGLPRGGVESTGAC